MNEFEKAFLKVLQVEQAVQPIFVQSPQGTLLFNASVALTAALVALFAPKNTTTEVPTSAPAPEKS